MSLILHPVTKAAIAAFQARPGQALLLHGPAGSGKSSLSAELARALLGIQASQLDGYAYLRRIGLGDVKTIGIEAVRSLEHFLSQVVPRPGLVNRVVLIEDAHALSLEAQNALLKTLEEPPAGTLIILLANRAEALLPTILSRVQTIAVKRPNNQQLQNHFAAAGHSSNKVAQAIIVSGGLPGLMQALLTNTAHPLQPATVLARQLLQQSSYQRLLLVDEMSKQRQQAIDVVYILQQMAHVRLASVTGAQFKRWHQILAASYQAGRELTGNTQPKLVLDQLMLNLG